MITKLTYNSDNLEMIYHSLKTLQEHNTPRDYEIRVDGLSVVPRTKIVERFYFHQEYIIDITNEVTVLLYYGNSRLNDKYILSHNQDFMTKEAYEKKLARKLKKLKTKSKLKSLLVKTNEQKETIKELESKINLLESSQSKAIKEVLSLLNGVMGTNNNAVLDDESKQIIEIIKELKKELGEELYNQAVFLGLTVARNPEIMDDVNAFVNQKLKENEE